MRKVTAILFILLLLLALPTPANAATLSQPGEESVTITTTVPDKHLLTVDVTNAKVIFGGAAVKTVYLERHSTPELTLLPDPGYEIAQVILDGVDVTDQVNAGFLRLPKICADMSLTVTTRKMTLPAGRGYTAEGTAFMGGKPLANATVQLQSTGATAVTNGGGKFILEGIRPGKNALTVYKDGKVLGYMAFTLQEGSQTKITVNADGSLNIMVDSAVEYFSFDLVLDGLGHMTITRLSGIYRFHGSNPHTGDIIAGFVIVMLLSGGALLILLMKKKKLLHGEDQRDDRTH